MAALSELREWEEQARSYWLECLMSVDEMLSMRADDPVSGCMEVLREAQDEAIRAGQKVRALQERIARLIGPSGPLPNMQGFQWIDKVHA